MRKEVTTSNTYSTRLPGKMLRKSPLVLLVRNRKVHDMGRVRRAHGVQPEKEQKSVYSAPKTRLDRFVLDEGDEVCGAWSLRAVSKLLLSTCYVPGIWGLG